MRRRDVDIDALAAGFDDTSRGIVRPAADEIAAADAATATAESAPSAAATTMTPLVVPGTVVESPQLLPPIRRAAVEPPVESPTEQVVAREPVRARTAPTLPTRPAPTVAPIDEPADELGGGEFDDVADGTTVLPTTPEAAASLRAPVIFRRRRRRPRVRRVTRVLRHVDTWSVFKVALVFNLFLYLVSLTAGVLLWQVAYATGTVNNVERFFEGFGWATFEFKGGEIYHNAWIAGLFVAAGLTGFAVLMATLFNLITDLVGGVRVTVLEEEVLPREERIPRTPRRTALPPVPAHAADEPVDEPVDGTQVGQPG